MNYYKTAVKLSWLCVGGLLSAFVLVRGGYQLIPFYLIFMVLGGTVPALICAWALRKLMKLAGMERVSNWILGGMFLGVSYVIISSFVMKSIIGHVSLGSIKGFLCLVILGPSILMESGYYGLLIVALAGAVNGAVLHVLCRRHLD